MKCPGAVIYLFILIGCAATVGCTSDVTWDPTYRFGWVPGRVYQLARPMDLVKDTGTSDYYFSERAGNPVGTVIGGINSHDQVVVQDAQPGMRFRMEKLIRECNPMATITVAYGRLVDGPYAGSVVGLWSVSDHASHGDNELVDRRRNDLVAPSQ
jgi:hypothetical protein